MKSNRRDITHVLERVKQLLDADSITSSLTPQGFDLLRATLKNGEVYEARMILSTAPADLEGWEPLESDVSVMHISASLVDKRNLVKS